MQNQNTQHHSPRCEVIRPEVIKDIRMHCSHIFAGGHRCASPALRGQTLCYHHQPSRIALPTRDDYYTRRRARRNFPVPRPTNQQEIRETLMLILHALAANTIAPPRAGRLLAALQHMNGDFSRNLSWNSLSTFHPDPESATIDPQLLLSQSRGPQ